MQTDGRFAAAADRQAVSDEKEIIVAFSQSKNSVLGIERRWTSRWEPFETTSIGA